ncbi:MAG: SapC family protein [Litorilituus sp.]|nr:SapC family protein [Litorilituus sp.]
MANIQAINSSSHGKIKIKENPSFQQSKDKHFSPLVVKEFASACQQFPIVFIKDLDTGQFNAVALLGLKPDENLFYDEKGWQGHYVPQALKLYPFLVHQEKDNNQAILCFDESSPLVNETEGSALFDNKGVQQPWLTTKGESVVDYLEHTQLTQEFIKILLEHKLLSPQSLNIKLANQDEYTLNGLYVIDEKILHELSDEAFVSLRKSSALAPIYSVLISMKSIGFLANKKILK